MHPLAGTEFLAGRPLADEPILKQLVAQVEDAALGSSLRAAAALELALQRLTPHPQRHRDLAAARNWIGRYSELGGREALWEAAEFCFSNFPEADLEHVRWVKTLWSQALRADQAATPGALPLDPRVLGPIHRPDLTLSCQSWEVALRTGNGAAASKAQAVLSAAGERYLSVGYDGTEYTSADLDNGVEELTGNYTPNWVSEPAAEGADVTRVIIDVKGLRSAAMARTMLRILFEESDSQDLGDAVLVRTSYHLSELHLPWDTATHAFRLA